MIKIFGCIVSDDKYLNIMKQVHMCTTIVSYNVVMSGSSDSDSFSFFLCIIREV